LIIRARSRHDAERSRRTGQAALADREGLSGAQAGNQARTLRKSRMERLHHHAALCIAAYGFLSQSGAPFPPHPRDTSHPSRYLSYPKTSGLADLPIRPERHVRNSIATVRITIARLMARKLDRCPVADASASMQAYNTVRLKMPELLFGNEAALRRVICRDPAVDAGKMQTGMSSLREARGPGCRFAVEDRDVDSKRKTCANIQRSHELLERISS
jgi:hypothetical protein